MGRAADRNESIFVPNCVRRRRLLHCRIDSGRHAPTDLVAVLVASRSGFSISLRPTELLRTAFVTITQFLARPRFVFMFVGLSIIPQSKLNRVDVDLMRHFVDRAFECEHAGRFARCAHRTRRCQIQLQQPMRHVDVRTGVQHSRHVAAGLGVFRERRRMRQCRMTQREEFSGFISADGKFLNRARARTSRIKHLRSSECDFDRSLRFPRRGGAKQDVTPLKSF